MKRLIISLLIAVMAIGALLTTLPAQAAQRTRCFAETGLCVAGPILDYWERNGGLPTFGLPITDLHIETVEGWTGPVQLFERDRLEDHGGQGVMAGRLGARLLEMQGRPWQTLPTVGSAPRGCRYFAETRHSLCGVFLNYWVTHGGLERFGFPLSEPMQETVEGWTGQVQFFERRRMEHHQELAGTPYEVLLGLLGRDIYQGNVCAPAAEPFRGTVAAYPNVLACPAPYPLVNVSIARQQFERGSMVWIRGAGGSGTIVVFFFDNVRNSLVWQMHPDTWQEGQPTSGGETPPPNLYEPIRGFGKLWRSNAQIRATIGWATAPEYADTGSMQYFRGGAWLIHRSAEDRVFVMYPDNRADDIRRIQ